jgi:hypothetical protein
MHPLELQDAKKTLIDNSKLPLRAVHHHQTILSRFLGPFHLTFRAIFYSEAKQITLLARLTYQPRSLHGVFRELALRETGSHSDFAYGGVTLYAETFQVSSAIQMISYSLPDQQLRLVGPSTPVN